MPLLVYAEHPHWKSNVSLDPLSGEARLTFNGSRGTYKLDDKSLEIQWDKFPGTDRFIFKNGRYLHVNLAEAPPVIAEIPGSPFKAELRRDSTDIAVYKQIFTLHGYDSQHLPKSADIVVDLGGNIGLASLFFAAKYPNARIMALEPSPDNFALLKRNLAQIGDRAVAMQAAIWSHDCDLQLHRYDERGNPLLDWGVQVQAADKAATETVHGWTMNRLIREFRLDYIDILKIDIEGAEKELFEAKDLSWLEKVGAILIETHERFRVGADAAVLRILERGFRKLPDIGDNHVFLRSLSPEIAASTEASTGSGKAKIPARPKTLRIALITAYYKEDPKLLERCMRSVREQSIAADHVVVADGVPQSWIDDESVRHIRLDRSHGDYGNTARGVGALLAVAEDYDGIGFLDADNWLEPDHIAQCLAAAATVYGEPCDYVIAQRNLKRPNETTIVVDDEPIAKHVDTNCFFFLPGSFHMIQRFAMIPQPLSIIGDRLFYKQLVAQQLRSAVVPIKTVNYQCMWESVYLSISETPPNGAKPGVDQRPIVEWLKALSQEQKRIVSRLTCLKLV